MMAKAASANNVPSPTNVNIARTDVNRIGKADKTSMINATRPTALATLSANDDEMARMAIPISSGIKIVVRTTLKTSQAPICIGIPLIDSNTFMVNGIKTTESSDAATSRPIVYCSVPPAFNILFGRIGGIGETDKATRAI